MMAAPKTRMRRVVMSIVKQVAKFKRNLFEKRSVERSVSFTNPHQSIMKHFNILGLSILICVGLSSCALSSPYCDAYNGVDFEQADPADDFSSEEEGPK